MKDRESLQTLWRFYERNADAEYCGTVLPEGFFDTRGIQGDAHSGPEDCVCGAKWRERTGSHAERIQGRWSNLLGGIQLTQPDGLHQPGCLKSRPQFGDKAYELTNINPKLVFNR